MGGRGPPGGAGGSSPRGKSCRLQAVAAARFPYLAGGLFGIHASEGPGSVRSRSTRAGGCTRTRRSRAARPRPSSAACSSAASAILLQGSFGAGDEDPGGAERLRPLWVRAAIAVDDDYLIPAGLELHGDPVFLRGLRREARQSGISFSRFFLACS